MLRLSLILILLLEGCWELGAQVGVKISGKIRILEPTTIKVETITGELLLSTEVGLNGEFAIGPKEIVPDVYFICFGETRQPVYLMNNQVTVKGFYN